MTKDDLLDLIDAQHRVMRQAVAEAWPAPAPSPPAAPADFFASFETSTTEGGKFSLQAKDSRRATLVSPGRHGSRAVQLQTSGSDVGIEGSEDSERADLGLSQELTDGFQGREHWWAHSVKLGQNFKPSDTGCVLLDFHHTGSYGQANFMLLFPGGTRALQWRLYGGSPGPTGPNQNIQTGREEYTFLPFAEVKLGVWYDFVYHIKWSAGSDGFANIWARREDQPTYKKYGARRKATLYANQGCYLKLANYHGRLSGPSAVIHDRVIRGRSAAAVAMAPLEGVKMQVNQGSEQ